LEEKGVIDFQRFVGVLDRIGCKFSDAECKALFYKHSRGSNVLTYQNICGLFFEMGSGVKDNKNPVYELANQKEGSITTPGMTKKLHWMIYQIIYENILLKLLIKPKNLSYEFYNIKLHYNEPSNTVFIQSAKNSLQTLPIRSYLDQTVVPLVLQALSALAQ